MDDPSFFGEDLDEEKAKRSILVTDVPENVSPKDVVIHFQKKSNGGGEVVNLDDHGAEHRSSVLITFDHPSVVETAIKIKEIKGKKVTVQRFPIETRIPEIFSNVEARINLDFFDGSVSLLKQVLTTLRRDSGITYYNNDYGHVVCGTLKQITLSHKLIEREIRGRKTTLQHYTVPETAFSEERGAVTRSTTRDDEKPVAITYQSDPTILRFILTAPKYAKRIQHIESRFNVKIGGIEGYSKVAINQRSGCTPSEHDDACEEYTKLYREINDGPMMCKDVLLRPVGRPLYSAEDVVKQISQMHPVVVQELEEADKWLFYGEDADVKNAIAEVCKMLNIDNPLRKARKTRARHATNEENDPATAYGHPLRSDAAEGDEILENPRDISPIHKDFPGDKDQPFAIKTKKGFRLTVYQGDITQDQVDVIVNTIDETFGFFGGLSGAVLNKGGRAIEREVEDESKRRKLKPGHIIQTGPGKLHCLKILHVITHRQSKRTKENCKSIAKRGCLECLKLAEKQKLTSIAFPALETGLQGITLDQCATVMANAVEEYMKDNDPRRGAVADIRFVHLDPRAAEVFKAELTKRYGDSIAKPTRRTGYGGDNDYTSSVPPPDRGVSHDKRAGKKEGQDVCPICLDGFHNPIALSKCKHKFCEKCIEQAFQHRKVCPTCGMVYGMQTGNMPPGTMNSSLETYLRLPGYERYGAIRIDYYFPSGTQGPEHPNPGQRYSGTSRTAYLPDCPEGREVLGLLRKAFDARLTFTIGRSVTTGASNVVTWNDIHHKTNPYGGATGFGYPDPTYLKRVKAELSAKGIS